MHGVLKISSYHTHTIAITTSFTLRSWGNNKYGELGLGDCINNNLPQELDLKHIVSVKTGEHYTIVLDMYGQLYEWGALNYINKSCFPTKIKLDKIIKSIFCAYLHTLCVTTDNILLVKGCNLWGQLGLGNTELTKTFKQLDFDTSQTK